jgi:four helix bundle protein
VGASREVIGTSRALTGRMNHDTLRKRTAALARRVSTFTRPLLRNPETHDVARQVRRSANDIASNYRAAGLARSHAEFTAKIGVVREESDETLYWLEHLRDTELPNNLVLTTLVAEAFELFKIFDKSYQTASGRKSPSPRPAQSLPKSHREGFARVDGHQKLS